MDNEAPAQRATISDTILDFGRPLLSQLSEPTSLDTIRKALEIVITVWNAHVMAMPAWGKPEHLAQLTELALRGGAPELHSTFRTLTRRRLERFADDPRVVSKWDVVTDSVGRTRFDCSARSP